MVNPLIFSAMARMPMSTTAVVACSAAAMNEIVTPRRTVSSLATT